MTNLRCTNCNEVKLESEFNFKNKSKGIRNSWCKSCVKKYKEEHKEERKEYDKKHYVENKEEIKECNKKYREENRELFKEHRKRYNDQRFKLRTEYLLAHPCVDCGESDPIVLEFDHIRGEKDRDIAYMILTNCPLGRIKAEIAKCEVRCANCHRRRHNQVIGGLVKRKYEALPEDPQD